MNVNAVVVLLVPTVKKLTPVHLVHVQIMGYVLTCHKDMKETHINVYVPMVSYNFIALIMLLLFSFVCRFYFILLLFYVSSDGFNKKKQKQKIIF